ncbi:MAG: hypothetical protein EZS28_012278 [Streblomastix strix]|uniref:Uncharacterized protein n=1 Tax=Streblomastix strix TaxID=222440 RepID=A0A5J4WB72_9EUKA|nr:MAG: hypothetical protein EZS28_012278 [Streblomastix strix]
MRFHRAPSNNIDQHYGLMLSNTFIRQSVISIVDDQCFPIRLFDSFGEDWMPQVRNHGYSNQLATLVLLMRAD